MSIATPFILPLDLNGPVAQLKNAPRGVEVVFIALGTGYPKNKEEGFKNEGFGECEFEIINFHVKRRSKTPVWIFVFSFFKATIELNIIENGNRKNAIALQLSKPDKKDYWYFNENGSVVLDSEKGDKYGFFSGMSKNFNKVKSIEYIKYVKDRHKNEFFKFTMSILTMYALIANIGYIVPESLIELHIFSHAFNEGPVLLNSYIFKEMLSKNVLSSLPETKLLDPDPRISDFEHEDFIKLYKKPIIKAFNKNGLSIVWGCDHNESIYDYVNKLYQDKIIIWDNKTKRLRFMNGQKEMTINEFRFWEHEIELPKIGKITIIKMNNAIQKRINNTYAQALANVSEKPVIAAMPGTKTIIDSVMLNNMQEKERFIKTRFLKLMHVIMNEEVINILRFYKQVFKQEFANKSEFESKVIYLLDDYNKDFGRGYAIYRSKPRKN